MPGRPADTAVLWAAVLGKNGADGTFALQLFASIASSLHVGDPAGDLAHVLITFNGREDKAERRSPRHVSCKALQSHLPGRECRQLVVPARPIGCTQGPAVLPAGGLSVITLDDRNSTSQPLLQRLRTFSDLSNAYSGVSTRPDLARGSSAIMNNLRFVADELLLPYGISRVLYLDADTCVRAPLSPLLQRDEHVVVAAERDKYSMLISTWTARGRNISVHSAERALIRRRWGFNSSQHQFNAGVLRLDLQRWCRNKLFDRITEVANYHARVHRLFRWVGGSNQAFAEVALVPYVHHVRREWNCRPAMPGSARKRCFIQHDTKCYQYVDSTNTTEEVRHLAN